jgi:DNA-binding transcriptional ArsR family regulator
MSDTSLRDDLIWKALADGTRRAVLDLLAKGPATTGELVERFDDLCRTAVMKHLDVLEAAGLLLVRRQGRVRWNHLNPVPIQRIHDRWVARHVRGAASAMTRLADHVEAKTATQTKSQTKATRATKAQTKATRATKAQTKATRATKAQTKATRAQTKAAKAKAEATKAKTNPKTPRRSKRR